MRGVRSYAGQRAPARAALLDVSGYAPTEVRITGVLHEYSALDGVQEDVVDILLNLKGVVLKLHNRTTSC